MQIGFLLASMSFLVAMFSARTQIGGAAIPVDGFWWGALLLFVGIQLIQTSVKRKKQMISGGLLLSQALTLVALVLDTVSLIVSGAFWQFLLLDVCWIVTLLRTWFLYRGLAEVDQLLEQSNTDALLTTRNHASFIAALVLLFAVLLPMMSTVGEVLFYGYQVAYILWACYQSFILTRIQRYYLPKPPEPPKG